MPNHSPATCLLWLRLDLRVEDNPAFAAAVASGAAVMPVYILDDEGEGDWPLGGASRWWLHHALADITEQLKKLGLPLVLRSGDSQKVLRELIAETCASAVYWNRRYEPAIIARDKEIKQSLRDDGLAAESFNAALIFEPWEIKNKSGKPFQVFTPYWKTCLQQDIPQPVAVNVSQLNTPTKTPHSLQLDELSLLPTIEWDAQFYDKWKPTRTGALARMKGFINNAVADYSDARNLPHVDGTSQLSPYLHFGQLGPREVYAAFAKRDMVAHGGGRKYIAEIGWREFSYHLLFHFPKTPKSPLREQFADFPWKQNASQLRAWQRGQTGYPIVDAGMRQLWATGWMHNRVRMITASLLVKHLLQPWQSGAQWFWDTLVDADLASNTQGWQWTGGCGADAAPYFRIFNPITQGEKFDPDGDYVLRWVPELKDVPKKYIHKPWEASTEVLAEAGVTLGEDYPEPIIGHFEGRSRALDAFEKLKKLSAK